ncbi:hypothetical protein ACF064_34610 [Streptomyces sp. NPDC015492]
MSKPSPRQPAACPCTPPSHQADQITQLLEQAKAVKGGETLLAKLTRL